MKILLFRKRTLAAIFLITVVAITAILFSTSVVRSSAVNASNRHLPIYRVDRGDDMISISFDAAWGNEDTQEIIDILAKYDVRATFFVVGEWVDKYPESVLALHNAGHEIMNHSDTHPYMTKISADDMLEQVETCSEKIENVTGVKPILFRPPYGDYNDNVISTLESAGYYSIQWDVDSMDWKNLSAEQITKRVVDKTRPGSIVLFHNAALHTPEALPMIIESLKAKGLQFVKISELIYRDNYKIDHTGQQYVIPDSTDSGNNGAGSVLSGADLRSNEESESEKMEARRSAGRRTKSIR